MPPESRCGASVAKAEPDQIEQFQRAPFRRGVVAPAISMGKSTLASTGRQAQQASRLEHEAEVIFSRPTTSRPRMMTRPRSPASCRRRCGAWPCCSCSGRAANQLALLELAGHIFQRHDAGCHVARGRCRSACRRSRRRGQTPPRRSRLDRRLRQRAGVVGVLRRDLPRRRRCRWRSGRRSPPSLADIAEAVFFRAATSALTMTISCSVTSGSRPLTCFITMSAASWPHGVLPALQRRLDEALHLVRPFSDNLLAPYRRWNRAAVRRWRAGKICASHAAGGFTTPGIDIAEGLDRRVSPPACRSAPPDRCWYLTSASEPFDLMKAFDHLLLRVEPALEPIS